MQLLYRYCISSTHLPQGLSCSIELMQLVLQIIYMYRVSDQHSKGIAWVQSSDPSHMDPEIFQDSVHCPLYIACIQTCMIQILVNGSNILWHQHRSQVPVIFPAYTELKNYGGVWDSGISTLVSKDWQPESGCTRICIYVHMHVISTVQILAICLQICIECSE